MYRTGSKAGVRIGQTPPDERAGQVYQPSSAQMFKERARKSQRDVGRGSS